MSPSSITPPQTRESTGAWFAIGGLRGRTVSAWVQNIGFAASSSVLGFVFGVNATGLAVAATLFAIGVLVVYLRWVPGRIALYEDRMRIERWKADKVITIPYSEMRHLYVHHTEFGVTRERGVQVPESYEITLHPVAAEDLLERLTEYLEQKGYRFTVDEGETVRSSWTWTLLELFPWQESTTTASLRIAPSGAFEFTLDRTDVLLGTNFKAWEIHAPGEAPASSAPALRLEGDRIVLSNGMVIGKVFQKMDGVHQIVFSSGSAVELQNGDVMVDDEHVGRIVRGGDRFVLELDRGLPEVIAVLALSVYARGGHGGHSFYGPSDPVDPASPSLHHSRELAVVGPTPRSEPLLRIESERHEDRIYRMFKFWHRLLHLLFRFFKREWRHSGWGVITFYRDSIHVVRDPVRELGEDEIMEFDLAYEDVTRLEFVAPDTLIFAFGPVTRSLNQQIAMVLGPMEAQDKFDTMVALLEDHGDENLFSVLDEGRLTHSREWTWAERFGDVGMTDSVTVEFVRHSPTAMWVLETAEEELFEVVEDHGLVLVRADEPARALMQVFHSQILDGGGFALSLVERDDGGVGFRTSRDERLTLTKGGGIRMGDVVIGEYPRGRIDTPDSSPDHLQLLYGSSPVALVPAPVPGLTFRVDHPIPKPWLLALAMVGLSRRGSQPRTG